MKILEEMRWSRNLKCTGENGYVGCGTKFEIDENDAGKLVCTEYGVWSQGDPGSVDYYIACPTCGGDVRLHCGNTLPRHIASKARVE